MSNKMPAVKECPYIHKGEKHSISIIPIKEGKAFAVFCGICGATGPAALTPKMAVEKWNRRFIVVVSEKAYEDALKKSEEDDDKSKD